MAVVDQAPAYVVTDADRERWALSGNIAEALWELYEDGPIDESWLWQMQRSIYRQEIPTGTAPALEEGEEAPPDPDAAEDHARAWEMWGELEASKPGEFATDDEHWAHVAKVCDLFDELFGNPDHIELGAYDGAVALHESEIEEAFGRVFAGAYSANLHPKDRLGKWTRTLSGIKAAAHDKGAELRQRVGGAVAARRARGGDAAKMRARAGGASKTAKKVHGRALSSLAYAYSEDAARKTGGFHESIKDSSAALETADRVQHTAQLAHHVAAWAVEHHNEIRVVGQALGHAARAAGLAGAATDEDAGEAVLILESLY